MLPTKDSDLLELALGDLIKCRADKGYVIDMAYFHFPRKDKCYVCAAGAVMAQTLGSDKRDYCDPDYFTDKSRLDRISDLVIDTVRCYDEWEQDLDCYFMDEGWDKFEAETRRFINWLRERGL